MRKIAMLNQKGGVGKTTSVVNIAAALANSGLKVAVADFDPQAHLTIHLGVEPDNVESGVYEVLTSSADFDQSLIEVRPNLFLLGANINLVGAESELVSVVGREIIFLEAVQKSQHNFDYLIIDCPPSLGLLTLNALACADEVVIPLQPHFLALQGLGKLLQTVTLVSKRINPNLKVSGVLLCMFDPRVSLSEEVKNDISNFFESARGTDCPWNNAHVIPVNVRRNIKLAEAPSYGKTVFEYEPECNGSKDYQQIADFLKNGPQPKQAPAVQPYQPAAIHPQTIPIRQIPQPIPIQQIPQPVQPQAQTHPAQIQPFQQPPQTTGA
jgi:chromosome partitioning protein